MKLAFSVILLSLVFGCTPKSKESSSRSPTETNENSGETSGETATVAGKVEQEDSEAFVDEIDIDDWSTFEAQNTAGTNLLLTQDAESPTSEKVAIYKLGKDPNGVHNFVPEESVDLSAENTFIFKVQAYTYYVVKYKKLTGFVPALAKDTILPLVLNSESSIAVSLFIRMVQSQDGKDLVDQKKVNSAVLESLAKKIAAPGITDYKAVIDSVLLPVLAKQKDIISDGPKTNAEIAAIVQQIIIVAAKSDTLTEETKKILKDAAAAQVENSGGGPGTAYEPATNPTNFSANAVSEARIDLTWVKGGASTTGYRISYVVGITAPATCSDGFFLPSTKIVDTSASVDTLSANTSYSFRLCAVNADPSGSASSGVVITKSTLQPMPPNPTGLTAVSYQTNQVTLNWINAGGSTVGYRISYQTGSTPPATCNVGTVISESDVSGTSHIVSPLTENTEYSFRICAMNSNPTPALSSGSTKTATTLAQANDVFHLAFMRQGNLYHLTGETGSWQAPTLVKSAAGTIYMNYKSFDLLLDVNREPYIALLYNTNGPSLLKHYTKVNNSWSDPDSEKVLLSGLGLTSVNVNLNAMFDSTSKIQMVADLVTPQAMYTTKKSTSTTQAATGFSSNLFSSCVDRYDTLWTAYSSSTNLYLKSRQKDSSFWTISAAMAMQSIGAGECLTGTVIYAEDIDCNNGKVTIAFRCHNSPADTVAYVANTSQGWLQGDPPTSVTPNVNDGGYLRHVVIHRDSADSVHLSSWGGQNDDAMTVSYWLNGTRIPAATKAGIDSGNSKSVLNMQVDSTNNVHFFFSEMVSANYALVHRHFSGASWVDEVIDSGNGINEIELADSSAIESNSGKSNWFTHHEIFVGTRTAPETIGSLANFDAACESLAGAVGKKGFKALLSTSTVDAKSRVTISGPVHNALGVVVAANSTNFWSGTWDTNANYRLNGTVFSGSIFTGSTAQGVHSGNNCADFSTNAIGLTSYSTGSAFSLASPVACNTTTGFWCISQP